MSLTRKTFYLLGCGKMASALLKSWLAAGIPASSFTAKTATDASAAKLVEDFGIHASSHAAYDGQDIVILGVKPQILPAALEGWKGETRPLYISLAAGTNLAALRAMIGADARIIRSMPNTPSTLGKGMTTLAGEATAEDKTTASALFDAAGRILWLDESRIDAAAAVAGSGPAYLFHFAEALIAAAEAHGFTPDEAKLLVSQTLSGSTALADASGWDISRLRQDVTSKAGVTEAALKIIMPALTPLLTEALAANIARSNALKNGQ